MKELTLKLICGNKLTFTNHDDRLLFLHSDSMSAQLVLNHIGVRIDELPKLIKVGFLSTKSEAYHSFYFKRDEFNRIYHFFKLLGFPLHGSKFKENL